MFDPERDVASFGQPALELAHPSSLGRRCPASGCFYHERLLYGSRRSDILRRSAAARLEYLYAERRFRALLVELGQSSNGGFQLARHVRALTTPFVFFTRKGTLEDAIVAYEDLGAAAVMKKPDPEGLPSADKPLADAYDEALRKASRMLVGRLNRIIDTHIARRKSRP